MSWRVPLLVIAAIALQAQTTRPALAEQDGFTALTDSTDLANWQGDRDAWKLEGGVLHGHSDGTAPVVLMVGGRDFGDFELRFEARVDAGAVRVKVRGPAPGPLGVVLEINTRTVEWICNGRPFFAAASNRSGEWKDYRVMVRGNNFHVWQNGTPSDLELAVGHLDARGKLSLHLSESQPSRVALRRLRIKE